MLEPLRLGRMSLRNAGVEKPTDVNLRVIRAVFLTAGCLISLAGAPLAQNVPGSGADIEWHVTVYPVLACVPLDLWIDVDIPPIDTDGGG